ncbi:MAG: hypothetical protein AAB091_05835, partial [Elusimicrobiota bacterium]
MTSLYLVGLLGAILNADPSVGPVEPCPKGDQTCEVRRIGVSKLDRAKVAAGRMSELLNQLNEARTELDGMMKVWPKEERCRAVSHGEVICRMVPARASFPDADGRISEALLRIHGAILASFPELRAVDVELLDYKKVVEQAGFVASLPAVLNQDSSKQNRLARRYIDL